MPKLKDVQSKENAYFILNVEAEAVKRLKNHLDTIHKDERTESEQNKDIFSKEQKDYLKNNPEQMLDMAMSDYLEFEKDTPDELMDKFAKTINENYVPLNDEQRAERESLRQDLIKKVAKYAISRRLATSAGTTQYDLDRQEQAIIFPGYDKETIAKNEEIARKINGTVDEQRSVYQDLFDEIKNMDISDIDLVDDKSFVNNFEKVTRIISLAPETTSIVKKAENLGFDFNDEEGRKLIEKIGTIQQMGYIMRHKIDFMSHPSYSQVDFSQLEENIVGNQIKQADGKLDEISNVYIRACGNYDKTKAEQYIKLEGDDTSYLDEIENSVNKTYKAALEQFVFAEEPSILIDKNLSPKERTEKYQREYRNTTKEKIPLERTKKYVNGELHEITREDRLKDKLSNNIKIIRETIPDFKMDEKDIDNYLTPERIRLHDRAKETFERFKKEKYVKDEVLYGFGRSVIANLNKSGLSNAKIENEDIVRLLNSATKEGDEFRKAYIANMLNAVQTLDPKKLSFNTPENERLEYSLEHYNEILLAQEIEQTLAQFQTKLGYKFSPEELEKINEIRSFATGVGGIGREAVEYASTELYLTAPLEKLSGEQTMMLFGSFQNMQLETEIGHVERNKQLGLISSHASYSVGMKDEKQIDIKEFSASDFNKGEIQDYEAYRKDIRESYEKLKAATGFLSSNSDEYRNLVDSFGKFSEKLDKMGNGLNVRDKDINELFEAKRKMMEDSKKYIEHVGKKAKNSRQQTRLDIAKSLSDKTKIFENKFAVSDMITKYNQELQSAGPSDTYDEVEYLEDEEELSPEEKEQIKNAEKEQKIFEEGLKKTEELRKKTGEMSKKNSFNAKDLVEFYNEKNVLDARDRLTELVGRKELDIKDKTEIKNLMAKVVAGEIAKKSLSDKIKDGANIKQTTNEVVNKSNAIEEKIKNSEVFNGIIEKIDSSYINSFLQGKGESDLHREYIESMKLEMDKKAGEENMHNQNQKQQNVQQNVL